MALTSKFAGLAVPADKPARMTIMHPFTKQPLRILRHLAPPPEGDDPPEDCYIDVLSSTSKVAREHDRNVLDRNIRTRGIANAEAMENDLTEKLARQTVGWKLATLEGDEIDVAFSAANARELYAMIEFGWIREQVLIFQADLGNWRAAASTS